MHTPSNPSLTSPIGVSLKHTYYREILENKPPIDFFEVHSENYMSEGGCSLAWLETIREYYPLSLHGVSLSLGTSQNLDHNYLKKLKNLIERIGPFLLSDHLSWSIIDGVYLNDLLPIPYTKESLEVFSNHISGVQDYVGQTLLIENPSSYIYFPHNDYSESQFLRELAERTGCKLLLDVNNLYVSSHNNGFDPHEYLENIPSHHIGEFHLAGHNRGHKFYIDDHGCCVQEEVWDLYKQTIQRLGSAPTVIEWDTNPPPLSILLKEADKAKNYQTECKPYE